MKHIWYHSKPNPHPLPPPADWLRLALDRLEKLNVDRLKLDVAMPIFYHLVINNLMVKVCSDPYTYIYIEVVFSNNLPYETTYRKYFVFA